MLCENAGLAACLDILPSAYLKENRATMSSRKDSRNRPQQAYSWWVADSESRTFTNGVWTRRTQWGRTRFIFNLHVSSVRHDNLPGTARGSPCPHDQEEPPVAPGTQYPAPTGPWGPKERRSPAGWGSSSYSEPVGSRCCTACRSRESGLVFKGHHVSLLKMCQGQ